MSVQLFAFPDDIIGAVVQYLACSQLAQWDSAVCAKKHRGTVQTVLRKSIAKLLSNSWNALRPFSEAFKSKEQSKLWAAVVWAGKHDVIIEELHILATALFFKTVPQDCRAKVLRLKIEIHFHYEASDWSPLWSMVDAASVSLSFPLEEYGVVKHRRSAVSFPPSEVLNRLHASSTNAFDRLKNIYFDLTLGTQRHFLQLLDRCRRTLEVVTIFYEIDASTASALDMSEYENEWPNLRHLDIGVARYSFSRPDGCFAQFICICLTNAVALSNLDIAASLLYGDVAVTLLRMQLWTPRNHSLQISLVGTLHVAELSGLKVLETAWIQDNPPVTHWSLEHAKSGWEQFLLLTPIARQRIVSVWTNPQLPLPPVVFSETSRICVSSEMESFVWLAGALRSRNLTSVSVECFDAESQHAAEIVSSFDAAAHNPLVRDLRIIACSYEPQEQNGEIIGLLQPSQSISLVRSIVARFSMSLQKLTLGGCRLTLDCVCELIEGCSHVSKLNLYNMCVTESDVQYTSPEIKSSCYRGPSCRRGGFIFLGFILPPIESSSLEIMKAALRIIETLWKATRSWKVCTPHIAADAVGRVIREYCFVEGELVDCNKKTSK